MCTSNVSKNKKCLDSLRAKKIFRRKAEDGPYLGEPRSLNAHFATSRCKGWIWVLIASVPDLCIHFTFSIGLRFNWRFAVSR